MRFHGANSNCWYTVRTNSRVCVIPALIQPIYLEYKDASRVVLKVPYLLRTRNLLYPYLKAAQAGVIWRCSDRGVSLELAGNLSVLSMWK
jgi:hypothetical protein